MPFYHSAGEIPHKRHTQFRGPAGALRHEALFSTKGFDGPYSLLYHLNYPGEVTSMEAGPQLPAEAWRDSVHRNHRMRTIELESSGDLLDSRRLMAFNDDVHISVASPDRETKDFYRNGLCDEVIVVVEGTGEIRTPFGRLSFSPGDMIVVPRGTTSSFHPDGVVHLLVIETATPVGPPPRYFVGSQLAEHSPFCERDFRLPELLPPVVEEGDFKVVTKIGASTTIYHLPRHPFDVVGWDGTHYPYIFNMSDFEPLTRRIHSMPHESQVFGAEGVLILCMVPRMLEYHPQALPAPPVHSSIDCDELVFNMGAALLGDKNRGPRVMTHHPRGLFHGVRPDMIETSIGLKEFTGKAIAIDTFRPLHLTHHARQCEDPTYHDSWISTLPLQLK